ncbi:MAG: hypothetical protein IJ760_01010 [Bacteroidales bacterium]|nr:hypothetical protein [Bacteroidales bacterium]
MSNLSPSDVHHPKNTQPLQECLTCLHFAPPTNPDGIRDITRAACLHTGLSVCPPRHVCEAWEDANGNLCE